MSRFALACALTLVSAAAHPAMAETFEFYSIHTVVVTSIDTLMIGDEEGHLQALIRGKGAGVRRKGPKEEPYHIEIWGTGDYHGDGTGADHGYGKFIFADDSAFFEEWEGTIKDGRAIGTARYYGGSGRFDGMEGRSEYDCTPMGDRFVCDVEGVIELP
ncbi:MAG: hypothetical protein VX733_12575 [Candidatus Latescibacterota bacterium]|nr:hypothetical protein [Candidatus Latescibacterota bacterium]